MRSAPADTLADEQRHLDLTWEAYEAVLRELAGERTSGIDEWAAEALERMRRERLRLYTESSGPLYFGRIDEEDGRVLHIGRHAIADRDNDLLAINWRAPAAQPFYTATPAERHGVVRRRRLEIEERTVQDFVDETLAPGEGDAALTDAIVEDITRRRVGEMRQIISTITPEQYELIAETVEGPLVIQGGPGTGKTAVGLRRPPGCSTPTRRCSAPACWSSGPNEVLHRLHQPGAPLARRDERGAAGRGDARARARPARRGADRGRHAEGQRPDGRAAGRGCSGTAWARPRSPSRWSPTACHGGVGPEDVQPLIDAARARFRSHQDGRERFRAQLGELDRDTRAGGPSRVVRRGHDELETLVRKTKAYQGLANKAWPRVTSDQLFAALFRNRKRLAAAAEGLLDAEELDLLLHSGPPADRTLRPSDVPLLDEARWLVDPTCARTATWSSTRRRTSRRWSCGWSSAAPAGSR